MKWREKLCGDHSALFIDFNPLLGDFIKEKDRCKKCKGKRLTEEDVKLEVRPVS